jgi:hypothetical protein
MGEAKHKLKKLRDGMLLHAEGWCFAPSAWESELVKEILRLPVYSVLRMPIEDLKWMRMQPNECHSNTLFYEQKDPTKQSKSITGWWLQGTEFILHSVVGCEGQFRCITPSASGETEIQFYPDSKIQWIEADNRTAAFRNGEEIGNGVRRFPAFTIAQNTIILNRLLSGMNPHHASEFSRDEMNALLLEYLTPDELPLVRWPVS